MRTKNKLRDYLSRAKLRYSSVINEILDPEICNKYGWVISGTSYIASRSLSFVKREKSNLERLLREYNNSKQ